MTQRCEVNCKSAMPQNVQRANEWMQCDVMPARLRTVLCSPAIQEIQEITETEQISKNYYGEVTFSEKSYLFIDCHRTLLL